MSNKEPANYLCFSSPLGWIVISASSEGICQLGFHDQIPPDQDEVLRDLKKLSPDFELNPKEHQPLLWDAKTAILEYFSKRVPLPEFPLDIRSGTAFQQDVWKSLGAIPFGETRSYLDIAESIGKPKAPRAVGQACGRNPIALIIPCHRVVAHDGKLGGYSSGLRIKRTLLDLERSG